VTVSRTYQLTLTITLTLIPILTLTYTRPPMLTVAKSYLLLLVFPQQLTLSFHAYHLPFLQILPTVALLSSSRLTTRITQTFTVTSEYIRFFTL